MRSTHIAAAALFAAAGQTLQAQTQQSQSIANRVSSAPDGRVQFTFAARPGTCGNGRSYIQTGPNSITGSINYNGNVLRQLQRRRSHGSVRAGSGARRDRSRRQAAALDSDVRRSGGHRRCAA